MLKAIFDIAYGGNGLSFDEVDRAEDGDALLGNDAEYPLCLAYAALAVRHLAPDFHPLLLLGNAQRRLLSSDSTRAIHLHRCGSPTVDSQLSKDSFEFVADS